jgi:hypothetical protein
LQFAAEGLQSHPWGPVKRVRAQKAHGFSSRDRTRLGPPNRGRVRSLDPSFRSSYVESRRLVPSPPRTHHLLRRSTSKSFVDSVVIVFLDVTDRSGLASRKVPKGKRITRKIIADFEEHPTLGIFFLFENERLKLDTGRLLNKNQNNQEIFQMPTGTVSRLLSIRRFPVSVQVFRCEHRQKRGRHATGHAGQP